MVGLGIPLLDETTSGFQQILMQKIYKQGSTTLTANLPSKLLGLLDRANQPTLAEHILPTHISHDSGSARATTQTLEPSLGSILLCNGRHTASPRNSKGHLAQHSHTVDGHSSFSKVFHLSALEGQLLAHKRVYVVSQHM